MLFWDAGEKTLEKNQPFTVITRVSDSFKNILSDHQPDTLPGYRLNGIPGTFNAHQYLV